MRALSVPALNATVETGFSYWDQSWAETHLVTLSFTPMTTNFLKTSAMHHVMVSGFM